MNIQLKRFIAILLIICISVGLGVLINEVWTALEKRSHPLCYDEIISECSREFDVPTYIIYATIKVESDFDPEAVSRSEEAHV